MSTKSNAFNAYETALNGGITDSATSFSVDANPGPLVQPAYMTIDPDDPTKVEVIRVGVIAGTAFSSISRGLAGSASGGQAHASGTPIRSTPVHQQLDDVFTDILALEAADTAHFGGTDIADHPESTPSVRGFISAADKTKLDALATADQVTGGDSHDHVGGDGAQIDHGGTGGKGDDDHTQYLNDTRHNNAHGALRAERITSAQSIPDQVNTTVIYNSVVDEDDVDGDITFDTGTGIATINNAGWYLIEAGVLWAAGQAFLESILRIRQNTSTRAQTNSAPSVSADEHAVQLGTIIKLAAADTVDVRVFQDNSVSAARDIQLSLRTFFAIVKLRE